MTRAPHYRHAGLSQRDHELDLKCRLQTTKTGRQVHYLRKALVKG
jgi:hypothetical protein